MLWYVVYNGRRLPTPYPRMRDAMDAIDQLRRQLGPGCYDIICEK